jgi:hypothetical protein
MSKSQYKAKFDKIENIINDTILDVNIINEESKFVIVTYWWGRGNLNKNFQRPCPDEVKEGQSLTKHGITFDRMAEGWVRNCKKFKCNFIAQEYPEFAVPGGYQLAINAKPFFIKKALDSCGGRAVVYMDTDMKLHRYPDIFDMKNIDYMARGWNCDPRANIHYKTKPCFDLVNFETSGGIMYFGPSSNSKKLLDLWKKSSKNPIQEGKADDRIISLLITSKELHIENNILPLPIEYLWLTDKYESEYLDKKHYNLKNVVVSHPECLTSEEKAEEQGAAKNRQPKFYDTLVENQLRCEREAGLYWEYVFFENKKHVKPWNEYLTYLNNTEIHTDDEELSPIALIPYDNMYGPFYNKIVEANLSNIMQLKKLKELKELKSKCVKVSHHDEQTIQIKGDTVFTNNVPNTISALFTMDKSCLYIPTNMRKSFENNVLKAIDDKNIELSSIISNEDVNYPVFNPKSPIFLSNTSNILKHVLLMTKNTNDFVLDFQTIFDKSIMFILLIRNNFIMKNTVKQSVSHNSSSNSSRKISKKEKTLTEGQKADKQKQKTIKRLLVILENNRKDREDDILQERIDREISLEEQRLSTIKKSIKTNKYSKSKRR